MRPRALILRSAGTNCDMETAHAFTLAGADPHRLHVNRLLENPRSLHEHEVLAIPGGFSYGDDIAAGRILANQLVQHLGDDLRRFVDSGKPIIGVCNGFQVLIKTDLLPGPIAGRTGQSCTLTGNDSARFIDRWVSLEARQSKCVWTSGLSSIELPIAHGEGRFVPADDAVRRALWDDQRVPLVYTKSDNPNGSVDDIAGICDHTGLAFGLMPHPERHVNRLQHPAWTSARDLPDEGPGLRIFRNAVNHVLEAIGSGV
ncbi:MAG: phosphoribosylformylglycinamidine synthase I [Tepidisphaeraceae bacterium]